MDLELAVRLSIKDASRFRSDLRGAARDVNQFEKQASGGGRGGRGGGRGRRGRPPEELGKRVDKVGARIHHTGLAMERMAHRTGTALVSIVQPALSYEAAIVDAVSVTGDAVSDMANENKLRAMSQQFASFGYTAEEVAEGIGYMGMAGLGTDQIIGSMKPTLQLAKAASLDLARTTDLSTDIMTAYALKMGNVKETQESMTRVGDVMTHTFTSQNTTLSKASESLFKIGNLAVQAGLSLETTAGAVGILAGAGIKGSDSGTALRNMLLRLSNPAKAARDTFKDLKIDVDQLNNAIARDDLPGAFKRIDVAMDQANLSSSDRLAAFGKIFGTRAANAAAFLTSQAKSGALEKQIADTRKSGGITETIADKKMKSDAAKVQQMKAELQQMGVDLGTKVLPGLMPVARTLLEMVKDAAKFIEKHPELAENMAMMLASFAGLGAVLGPIATSVGGATRGIGLLISMTNATKGSAGGLAAAIGGAGGGGGVAGAAASATSKVSLLSKGLGWAGLATAAGTAGYAVGTFADNMLGISDKLANVGKGSTEDGMAGSNVLAEYLGLSTKRADRRGTARLNQEESETVRQQDLRISHLSKEREKNREEMDSKVPIPHRRKMFLQERNRAIEKEIEDANRRKEGVQTAAHTRTLKENANREKYRPMFEKRAKELNEMRMGVDAKFQAAYGAKGRKKKTALTREAEVAKAKYESEEMITAFKAQRLGLGMKEGEAFENKGAGWRKNLGIDLNVKVLKDGSIEAEAIADEGFNFNPDAGDMTLGF